MEGRVSMSKIKNSKFIVHSSNKKWPMLITIMSPFEVTPLVIPLLQPIATAVV